ncbi:MAG: amino acid ABC transporter substrate-binding protein [Candidatus Riflebacteria bacterium]|nr:amino acid ABC transporter substrate-binding protein [Candidatus Riflebacteria bacterium]
MISLSRWSFPLALLLLAMLALPWSPGCGEGGPAAGAGAEHAAGASSSLAAIRERGYLIVGTAITKPFEFHDPDTNELVGLDVEIATGLASRLGVKCEFREMPFAALIPSLETGKVDMTIGAMHVTDARRKSVDFAEPYLETGLVMVVPAQAEGKLLRAEDLQGRRVGVKLGSTGDQLAQELLSRGLRLERKEYKETLESLLDLEFGRLDVVLNDYLNTLAYFKDHPSQIKLATTAAGQVSFLSRAGFGVAFRKGSRELVEAADAALRQMKTDGTIRKIHDKWLAASR